MKAVNPELFARTAPKWNCVDYPGDGMHYLSPDGSCQWCGHSREQIAAEKDKRHFCIPCNMVTEHEREATLPADYRSGDPDYEDRSKCGRCGEVYQCQECGAPWDITRNECSSVADFGHHGPE